MLIDFSERKLAINALCATTVKQRAAHVQVQTSGFICPTSRNPDSPDTHIAREPILLSRMLSTHLCRNSQLPKCSHSEHKKSLLCPSESPGELPSIWDWGRSCSPRAPHPASSSGHMQLVWSSNWRNKVCPAIPSRRRRGFFLKICPSKDKILQQFTTKSQFMGGIAAMDHTSIARNLSLPLPPAPLFSIKKLFLTIWDFSKRRSKSPVTSQYFLLQLREHPRITTSGFLMHFTNPTLPSLSHQTSLLQMQLFPF